MLQVTSLYDFREYKGILSILATWYIHLGVPSWLVNFKHLFRYSKVHRVVIVVVEERHAEGAASKLTGAEVLLYIGDALAGSCGVIESSPKSTSVGQVWITERPSLKATLDHENPDAEIIILKDSSKCSLINR